MLATRTQVKAEAFLNFYFWFLKLFFFFFRNDYNDNMIPMHPCLKLVANSEQDISAITSRRLLTYEKLMESNEKMDANQIAVMDNFDDFRNK